MLKFRWLLMAAVVAVMTITCSARAEEAAGEGDANDWLIGKVVVQKDDKGAVKEAALEVDDIDDEGKDIKVSYKVTLDEVGQKMAKEMVGKKVDVTCKISKKGDEKKPELWIKVTEYTEVKDNEEEAKE